MLAKKNLETSLLPQSACRRWWEYTIAINQKLMAKTSLRFKILAWWLLQNAVPSSKPTQHSFTPHGELGNATKNFDSMFANCAESCCCNSWLCSLALASTPWETICFILPSRKVGLLSASHLPQMFTYFFPTSPHGWHGQSLSHMRVPCLAPEPGNQHLPCWSSLTAGSFETSSNIL